MANNNLIVHEDCKMQVAWGRVFEKEKRYDTHVHEGEKQGGHRDRLAKVEVLVDGIMRWQSRQFIAACVGGFIGGLFGRFMPWLVEALGRTLGMK